jgi:hypothetical protein
MIIFRSQICKAVPDYPEAIRRLRGFLEQEEPELIKFLHHFWKDQQNAITYKELGDAIRAGGIDSDTLNAWRQDYARFISNKMLPKWQDAMRAAGQQITEIHDGYAVNLTAPNVLKWTQEHAG